MSNKFPPAPKDYEEFLKELGYLTMNFSFLESLMIDLIGKLIGCEKIKAMAIATNISFINKIKLSESLITTIENKEDKEAVKSLLGDADTIREERNRLIHDVRGVTFSPENGTEMITVRTKTGKNGVSVSSKKRNVDDISELNNKIKTLSSKILEYVSVKKK